MDIHNCFMDIHKYRALRIYIIELGISIIELWISMTLLWMSIFNYGCPSLKFWYPLIRIRTMDSHNRIMVIQNSFMDIHNLRIYSCLASRIQPNSRFPEFTAVLSISYCFYYTARSTKLKGVYSFHLACLGQNRVRCVYSTILAISISQPTSEGVSRVKFCEKFQNLNFLPISFNLHLSLCLLSV